MVDTEYSDVIEYFKTAVLEDEKWLSIIYVIQDLIPDNIQLNLKQMNELKQPISIDRLLRFLDMLRKIFWDDLDEITEVRFLDYLLLYLYNLKKRN